MTDPEDIAHEARQLRKLFIEPSRVTVDHAEGMTWATDGFVLLDITGTHLGTLQGVYRVMVSHGYRETKGAALDLALTLENFASDSWSAVHGTGWSVYDSEAKLYLLADSKRQPRAVNEDLWQSFREQYPAAAWQVDSTREKSRFRIISDSKVIAYAAGVTPEDTYMQAARAICLAINQEHEGN
jgi:hypothetical protein